MATISSQTTSFCKRWLPSVWLGGVSLALGGGLYTAFSQRKLTHDNLIFIALPMFMLVFGYVLFRSVVFDLVDEVVDDGDSLIVRNKGLEARVPISAIMNVNYNGFLSPKRITLTLRDTSQFGVEIAFIPIIRPFGFSRHPIATDLMQRMDAARRIA